MRKIKIGEKEYPIHYGQNAICALENELDESIGEFYSRLRSNKMKLSDVRAIIWAGMLKDNRNITPEEVGELCDTEHASMLKLLPECLKEFDESFERFIPPDEEPEESGKNE